ncbi:hypothetical protein G6011_00067 [Alternaria panax]|uniref:HD/PDEase domain-containing protein n=1 Tax=Alternaria panax TaxID=48097 RepID=A0AAD4NUD6_9PLEO|nr:hypothetical protein G6011_00067 [Alternaria panax]
MASQILAQIPVPQVPIPEEDKPLFASINAFVYDYMSKYDNSHDYQHILRVLSNTRRILIAEQHKFIEQQTQSYGYSPKYEHDDLFKPTSLFLAALLHDVGDHKYAKPDENADAMVLDLLLAHGAKPDLACKVQQIVFNVSYTNEIRNPGMAKHILAKHPELGIVQDADRLDAIGAVGIARCFSFGAAKMPDQPMDRAVGHFEDKLYKLEGMMKTEEGKEMARERHKVLERFAEQWKKETRLTFEME